jgi:hypothetical protein
MTKRRFNISSVSKYLRRTCRQELIVGLAGELGFEGILKNQFRKRLGGDEEELASSEFGREGFVGWVWRGYGRRIAQARQVSQTHGGTGRRTPDMWTMSLGKTETTGTTVKMREGIGKD